MKTPDTLPAPSDPAPSIDTEHGVRAGLGGLAAAIAEYDANPTVHIRHYVAPAKFNESWSAPKRSACGIDGLVDQTNAAISTESSVTCEACKTELAARHARRDRRTLQRLRTAASSGGIYIREIERGARERLLALGQARIDARDYIHITVAGRDALVTSKKKGAV